MARCCAASSSSRRLPPLEQLLDIGKLELDVSRAPVIALAGEGLLLHVAEQRVHLNGIEAASGAHAAMACHGREHMVETFRNNKAPLPFDKLVGEIAHQPLDISLAKQCRNFAHDQR